MWRLEVADWTGPTSWRWRLFDGTGADPVAEHAVALDPTAWQFEAFTDLYGYLGWNRGSAVMGEIGDWIGREVLGSIADVVASARRPVRVELPAAAAVLGCRPWELARVAGTTLAAARVRIVVSSLPHRPLSKAGVGTRLRMLAVFSLPDGGGALNLRRERYELAKLVQRIAKVNGKAIELRVLQYGATRERLRDALLEADGWDVVHLSGHGLPAGLVLEDDTGRHDLISSTELVDLLDLAGEQLKLVTLSACESGAVTAAEHLHLLGLAPTRADRPTEDAAPLPAIAAEVVSRLDCAVLAMRYPVADEFAIDLAGAFYDLLLGKGQTVARALALSLAPGRASELSTATPALFGPRAVDLTLVPPDGGPSAIGVEDGRLGEFPDQPPRFVGRVGPLTRAAAALAPGSGRPGVVLHGMAGAGKTACALELAYTHEQSFPLTAWWAAPPDGADIRPALTSFALATERQLPGLAWVHLVEDAAKLRDFLPQLTQIFERNRILLVVDNAESLLTEDGRWRDERWAAVVAALTAHHGLSRLVLTSRRRPADLAASVLVEPVHALSLPESMLLARELPGLRALLDGGGQDGSDLVARVLRLAQGHPKLLELADGAAVDPAALAARLDEADRLWLTRATRIDTFVDVGTSAATAVDFGSVLAGWARSAAAHLPPTSLLLFQLICGVEEADRQPNVIASVWPRVWEGAGNDEPAPDVGALLTAPLDAALLASDADPDGLVLAWRVHPGIADTTRTDTDLRLTVLIDDTLADVWMDTLRDALRRETEQQGAWLLRAARSAAPYLLRRRRWTGLASAAEHVLVRDRSVAAAAALAPLLDVAAAATRETDDDIAVARTRALAVLTMDSARGITLLQHLLDLATTRGDHICAANVASDLVNCYRDEGRYEEALTLVDQMVDHTRRAERGPWTQLACEAQRLQIQRRLGHFQFVLDAVEQLQMRMADLPSQADSNDPADPWNVRETILGTGVFVARDLGWLERALEFNAEVLASLRRRGASDHEQASAAFNDYGPLVRLGRWAQARDLLTRCRTAFDAADDILGLGKTLGALADVEHGMGHLDRAIDFGQQALRYSYVVGNPDDIGASHHNLANYLQYANTDPATIAAHQAAAALIAHQTGDRHLLVHLVVLGQFLTRQLDAIPDSFDQVCRRVAQVPGIDLIALFARLPRRAPDGDTALHAVLDAAPEAAARAAQDSAARVADAVTAWEPVLSALHIATTHSDPATRSNATTTLDVVLDRYAATDDWRNLAAVLRRIQRGERDPGTLLLDLDEVDTAITQRALDILARTADVNPTAWHAIRPRDEAAELAAAIVAAAAGDEDARAHVEAAIDGLAAAEETAELAAALRNLLDGVDAPLTADIPPDQAALLAAAREGLGRAM